MTQAVSGCGGGSSRDRTPRWTTLMWRKTISPAPLPCIGLSELVDLFCTLNQLNKVWHHPMPSSGAGGGTGRSWYSLHMSGFGMCGQCHQVVLVVELVEAGESGTLSTPLGLACVANASSGAGGGTGKEVKPALFPHCLAERQWTFRGSMAP